MAKGKHKAPMQPYLQLDAEKAQAAYGPAGFQGEVAVEIFL